jgi:2'-5' RNA ligase
VPDLRRLFLALWPDEAVRRDLIQVREWLEGFNGLPMHPEDLHVTLVFLGAVAAQRQACVEATADAIRARPFELSVDRFGFWPRPRILWCGPGETPDALGQLVRDLQKGLEGCGFQPERRPFAAHVTLARKAREIPCPELERPVLWPVREFVLVASRPGGNPPRYEVLRSWMLSDVD